MWFLKRRFLISVLCLAASAALTWSLFNTAESTKDTARVVRVARSVEKGTMITQDMLKSVEVGAYGLDSAALNSADSAVGLYAAADLFPGDNLTAEKLTTQATFKDVFAIKAHEQQKAAVSVAVDSVSASLSGKLQRGDVVSAVTFVSANGPEGSRGYVKTYPELMYLEIVAVTNSKAADIEREPMNDGGSQDGFKSSGDTAIPASVTFMADEEQALSLVEAENIGSIHLIFRGRGQYGMDLLAQAEKSGTGAARPLAGTAEQPMESAAAVAEAVAEAEAMAEAEAVVKAEAVAEAEEEPDVADAASEAAADAAAHGEVTEQDFSLR